MPRPFHNLPPLLLLLLLFLSSFHLSSAVPLSPGPSPGPSTSMPPNGGKGNDRRMPTEFIRAHNAVRATIGEQPVSWDRTLARHARSWSERRRGDCELVHSGDPRYGENMFWGSGWEWRAADAVKYWADEHLYYDPVNNSCEPGKVCGHFTQMVWNTTVKVGCGRAECYNGDLIITCNYFPPGNYVGEKPF